MSVPSGPLNNTPLMRSILRDFNAVETVMKIFMETDENDVNKGLLFIKFDHQGDDRFIPVGEWTAGAAYPITLSEPVEVGSRLIKEVLGEDPDDIEDDVIKKFLSNAGFDVPPAPLEAFIELGSPGGQRKLTGNIFIKYGTTQFRRLNDYDFVIASLQKPEVYTGDLAELFDPNHVDARFVTDFNERNT